MQVRLIMPFGQVIILHYSAIRNSIYHPCGKNSERRLDLISFLNVISFGYGQV